MAARERRPQPKPERELPVDIDIDKEKLKKVFDVSHFDINAVLRGVELTLVGGRRADHPRDEFGTDTISQPSSPEPGLVQL